MPEAYAASIERLRALAGTPRDPDGRVLVVVAEYLRREGRLDEAARAAQDVIARHPDFASAQAVWAQVQTDRGDLEGARATVARLLELDRHNTRAIQITQSLDAADEAAALDWARAQGVGPAVEVEDEVVTVTLGELYLEQGAPDRAAEVAEQLLTLDPSNDQARALLNRATSTSTPATPVEELAPEPAPKPVEEPAPEPASDPEVDAVLIADLAPEVTPIADLAPVAVPIATLAPEVVPVGDLAPEPVAIADLAPPVTDVGSLAPESSEPAKADDENDLDDFMSWLDEN